MEQIVGLLVSALMAVGGFGLGLVNAIDLYKAHQSASWSKVDGKVISSKSERGCRKGGSFYPSVVYEYETDGGGTHKGNLMMFGLLPCGTESYANELAAKFPVGQAIKVSVNPSNMFESVLFPGEVRRETWFFSAGMAFFFAIGTAITISQLRGK